MILLGILVVLAGVGIAWLWQYAYAPEGRARVIIAQLKGDTTSLRGWMLQHHLVRQGYSISVSPLDVESIVCPDIPASEEMLKLGREVSPIAGDALQDENFDVRAMAIRVCGGLRDPAAIDPLVRCMCEALPSPDAFGEGRYAQGLCLESLIEIGPASFGPLMQAFKSCRPSLPYDIPGMMADKWGAAAVPHFMELLDDPDAMLRNFAVDELVRLKDKRSAGVLLRHLRDKDKSVRELAVDALGAIGDVPSLLAAMKDNRIEADRRFEAAGHLARMGNEEGLQFLLSQLESSNPWTRTLAVDNLAATPKTIGRMLPLLGDSDETVRVRTIVAVRKSHDPRVIPTVRKLMNDPDPDVRQAATDALHDLGVKPPAASQPGKP